jgi:hypothetical protein
MGDVATVTLKLSQWQFERPDVVDECEYAMSRRSLWVLYCLLGQGWLLKERRAAAVLLQQCQTGVPCEFFARG